LFSPLVNNSLVVTAHPSFLRKQESIRLAVDANLPDGLEFGSLVARVSIAGAMRGDVECGSDVKKAVLAAKKGQRPFKVVRRR
jgi:hypothetical protein